MWIQNIVHNACPICGKEITLAVVELHPTYPEMELHTYRCVDCGPVKTTSHRRRPGKLPQAASWVLIPRPGFCDSPIVPLAGLTRDNIGRLESVPPLAVMTGYKGVCMRIGVPAAIRIAFNGQYLFCDRAFCDEIKRTGLNL